MRALLFLMLLTLPALAQPLVEALHLGDYVTASKLAPAGSRQAGAAALGLGRAVEALAIAEKLLAGPLDAHEELATRLLAVQAASRARLTDSFLQHLQKLETMPLPQGVYGDVAAFLIDSHRIDRDVLNNLNLPLNEILSRHDQTWARLKSLETATQTGLQPFLTELYWIPDIYFRTWYFGVLPLKRSVAENDPRVKELQARLDADLTTLIGLGAPVRQQGHPELSLGRIWLVEQYLLALQKDPAGLKITAQGIRNVEGFLANETGQPELRAYLAMLKANQAYLEGDAQAFPGLMNEARPLLQGLEAWKYFAKLNLDYYQDQQPPGWLETSDKLLALLKAATGLQTQDIQVEYYYRLGQLRALQGRRPEATAAFQQAVDLMESTLRHFQGGSALMGLNKQLNRRFYEALAQNQLQAGEAAEAFQTLGRLQQIETATTFTHQDLLARVQPADQGLVQRAQETQRKMQAKMQEVASLKATGAEPSRLNQATEQLAATRQTYVTAVTELEKKYKEFAKLDVRPVNFTKLQRAIPADTLVVLFFPTADGLFLMEASSDKLAVRTVKVTRAQLNQLVADFRSAVLARKPTGSQLYTHLIAPLEADLQAKGTLALIPYGSLMYLPFGALTNDAGQYLIEGKRVVTLCKATDLDQIFGPPAGKTGALVALGNPDGSLPAATLEVQALGALFPGSKIFVEGQATSDKLKSVMAPAVAYLHLATHGVLDSRDPRASYLVLAGGQRLSVPEITGARLDCAETDMNLVTLSACQTALAGRDPDGSDLRSLADAFSVAGCRSVVASLWSVSDDSTRLLMTEFYKNLKAGQSKAQALQGAQVSLLKQPQYASPFYWAPFVLIGDWR